MINYPYVYSASTPRLATSVGDYQNILECAAAIDIPQKELLWRVHESPNHGDFDWCGLFGDDGYVSAFALGQYVLVEPEGAEPIPTWGISMFGTHPDSAAAGHMTDLLAWIILDGPAWPIGGAISGVLSTEAAKNFIDSYTHRPQNTQVMPDGSWRVVGATIQTLLDDPGSRAEWKQCYHEKVGS